MHGNLHELGSYDPLMAFYTRDGDTFVPTNHCIGPWDVGLQHGGPPAALLAGAVERFGDDASAFFVARVTVELLRPIGLIPLSVQVTPLRLGRQAQWLQADLVAGDKLVARATVVRIARSSLALPEERTQPAPPPPSPDGKPNFIFPFFRSEEGYHRAVDLRVVEGEWGKGPCTAWMRAKYPLVEGTPTSGLESTMILADATNGVAPSLPIDAFTFINPDLTVHLLRPPTGAWLGLEARSLASDQGTGLVQSRLFDRDGEVGRCVQSLVVRPT